MADFPASAGAVKISSQAAWKGPLCGAGHRATLVIHCIHSAWE